MAAQVDVFNMALARCGVFNAPNNTFATVQDVKEQTKEAMVCRLFYDMILDYVLMSAPWTFATTRLLLTDKGTPPANWHYRYAYPSDCLNARYITYPGLRNPREDMKIPFQIGTDGTAREIYTDMETPELVYTARVVDLNLWGPMATSALAYRLGAEISTPLSLKPDVATNLMGGFYRELSIASAEMMNEGQGDVQPMSELLAIRGLTGPLPPDGLTDQYGVLR